MATAAASVQTVSERLHAARGNFTARQVVVAYARHCSSAASMAPPTAFAHDPASPPALAQALVDLPVELCTVDQLGIAWEQLIEGDDRRTRGAHFTPRPVADRVAELSLDLCVDRSTKGAPGVWDPACGGGAFLLAACRWLERHTSFTRAAIVASMHATDLDETALDVCDAALELWSGGAARPTVTASDSLLDLPADWPADFDVVIGNPPFLGQLTSDTSRSAVRRAQLATSFESANGAYIDEAGLFVELSLRHTAAGGVVALVIPESLLGARDAEAMRTTVSSHARLARLWIDEGQSFEAAVDVVAAIMQRHRSSEAPTATTTELSVGVNKPIVLTPAPTPEPKSWAPLLANALGVPPVHLVTEKTLGDRATVTAGFRQHFYGIADAVIEADVTSDIQPGPKLITSGAIEPLRLLWADKPVKFAGTRWTAPVLQLGAIEDDAVRDWFAQRCVPKLLLASQTKVVEVVVDTDGSLVPSVPVVSVEPQQPADLWHLAAALSAPAVSAWMLTEAAGTGLSHDAIRVRAATLATAPLPTDQAHWNDGALHAQRAHAAAACENAADYICAMRDLATSMQAAYGVEEHVGSWWWERIRLPSGSDTTLRPRLR